jgi:plasmid stabilization system protein ParE
MPRYVVTSDAEHDLDMIKTYLMRQGDDGARAALDVEADGMPGLVAEALS